MRQLVTIIRETLSDDGCLINLKAEQLIQCRDCKHHDDECLWCKVLQRETENDCYCSLAKRRNGND